jgi:serine/threonine protein kinase
MLQNVNQINLSYNRRIQVNNKANINMDPRKNNYKLIKEYYKVQSNLEHYLQNFSNSNFSENFELLQYIGSGSSGVVYEGRCKREPQKHVCLKFLLNKSEEEKREKKYKKLYNLEKYPKIKEINIQGKLKDRHITQYYDYCDLKDYGCIIMEYAKFGDLENFQKKINHQNHQNSLSETLLAYLTRQILEGLYYIHQSKIIHMDIKQQNILIDQNFNIKITDFSVSFSYENYKENDKITLPLSGTSFYMSPEVLLKAKIDYEDCSKIDMFSLGVLLYNIAYEKFPFSLDYSIKRNFQLILEKIQTEKLVIPGDKKYSILFKKFLESLLERNIKNRISVSEALDNPWIKGTDLLIKEKEKINNLEKFIINIMMDNVRSFNEYLKNNNSDTFHTSSN